MTDSVRALGESAGRYLSTRWADVVSGKVDRRSADEIVSDLVEGGAFEIESS